MSEKSKIKSFTDLKTWQGAHNLVLLIYSATKSFPKEELFGLTSQMRRCSASISSNIAEGFSRHSYKEKIQFYSMALGSITEFQNQILIAKDIDYITEERFQEIAKKSVEVHKMTNALIKCSRKFDS